MQSENPPSKLVLELLLADHPYYGGIVHNNDKMCGISRLAQVVEKQEFGDNVKCILTEWWPGSELPGACTLCASTGRSLSSSCTNGIRKDNVGTCHLRSTPQQGTPAC